MEVTYKNPEKNLKITKILNCISAFIAFFALIIDIRMLYIALPLFVSALTIYSCTKFITSEKVFNEIRYAFVATGLIALLLTVGTMNWIFQLFDYKGTSEYYEMKAQGYKEITEYRAYISKKNEEAKKANELKLEKEKELEQAKLLAFKKKHEKGFTIDEGSSSKEFWEAKFRAEMKLKLSLKNPDSLDIIRVSDITAKNHNYKVTIYYTATNSYGGRVKDKFITTVYIPPSPELYSI